MNWDAELGVKHLSNYSLSDFTGGLGGEKPEKTEKGIKIIDYKDKGELNCQLIPFLKALAMPMLFLKIMSGGAMVQPLICLLLLTRSLSLFITSLQSPAAQRHICRPIVYTDYQSLYGWLCRSQCTEQTISVTSASFQSSTNATKKNNKPKQGKLLNLSNPPESSQETRKSTPRTGLQQKSVSSVSSPCYQWSPWETS